MKSDRNMAPRARASSLWKGWLTRPNNRARNTMKTRITSMTG